MSEKKPNGCGTGTIMIIGLICILTWFAIDDILIKFLLFFPLLIMGGYLFFRPNDF